jgi:hypothetical protein
MSAVCLGIPRSQRPARIYQPRNRRHCLGKLIQIDGGNHPDMSAASTYVPTRKELGGRCGTYHDRSVHQYALSTR